MRKQLIVNDGRGDAEERHGGQKGGERAQRDATRKTEILVADVNLHSVVYDSSAAVHLRRRSLPPPDTATAVYARAAAALAGREFE